MRKARLPLGLSLGRAYLIGFLLGGSLLAPDMKAGSPRLASVYPGVLQRGAEQEITLSGSALTDARTLLFDEAGFEVSVVKAEPTKLTVKVKPAAAARLGEHRFRVVTESGISDLRYLFVSPFPIVEEANPKDPAGAAVKAAQRAAARAAAKAAHAEAVAKAAAQGQPPPPPLAPESTQTVPDEPQLVALNTTVYGRVPGEDVDQWAVDLAAGQRLSIEVGGFQLQSTSPFDPEIVIKKPDGSILKTVGGTVFGRGNPVVSMQVAEAGRYSISIRDVTQSAATGVCHYFMHVGDFPRPTGAIPAGAAADSTAEFTLIGTGHGTEKGSGTVLDTRGGFGGLFLKSNTPSPVPVRVNALPNVVEGPQVHQPADAQGATTLPAAFNGVISKPREADYFRFTAKKSEAFHVNVYARALRSRLDSLVDIYSATGVKLGTNDDSGSPDSYLRFVAPADGEFILAVRDQQWRGGEDFHYRVEIEPVVPRVKAYLPEMVINSSQERRAVVVPRGNRYATMVRIKREDFAGAVQLRAENLPAGVTVTGGRVAKGADTALMVFEASADAPADQRLFNITGEALPDADAQPAAATAGGSPVAALSPAVIHPDVQIEHLISTGEIGNGTPLHRAKETLLPVSVAAPVPVAISVAPLSEPAMRGATYPVKVKVERRDDFKGAVEVSLLYGPTGISTVGPVKVPEDVTEVVVPLSVAPVAALGKSTLCMQATLDPGVGRVWVGSNLYDLEVAEAPLAGTFVRSSISQGGSAVMKLKVTPKTEFTGKLKVELLGLPTGVTAEPREADAQTTEIEFPLTATQEAAVGLQKQVIAQFTVARGGVELVATCATGGIIRVDRGSSPKSSSNSAAPISVAKNEPAKPAAAAPDKPVVSEGAATPKPQPTTK